MLRPALLRRWWRDRPDRALEVSDSLLQFLQPATTLRLRPRPRRRELRREVPEVLREKR